MTQRICSSHLYTIKNIIPITLLWYLESSFPLSFSYFPVNQCLFVWFFLITKAVISSLEDSCHFFQSVLFMVIAEKWMNGKEYRTIFRVQKIQKGSIQVTIPFISCSLLITDRRKKCGTYSRFPTWLCCFSAKRKTSKLLCKILNIMSQIFFRVPGGKTAKRKCFSIGVIILTSFPKQFGIHISKVTSIFKNKIK